jgi:predicted DNA-binding mobile mystery protein A
MVTPSQQLDKRFEELKSCAQMVRPPRGWIRAIRDALGMTTAQLARRLGVKQPRVVELEQGEVSGSITIRTLERAAEALGCRVIYALVPMRPLTETMRQRATVLADQQLASVEQTMRLEAQAVDDQERREEGRQLLVDNLLRRPKRLWDEP